MAPPRRLRFCSDEKPRCIDGHRLRNQQRLTSDGLFTCTYRAGARGPECGKLCWAALVSFGGSPKVRGSGERLWIVVELSPADASFFTRTPMTLLERLDHLGYGVDDLWRDFLGGLEPELPPPSPEDV